MQKRESNLPIISDLDDQDEPELEESEVELDDDKGILDDLVLDASSNR